MDSEDRYYLAALVRTPGVGSRLLQQLLAHFTSARAVWEADGETLVSRGGLSSGQAQRLAVFCRQQPSLPEQLAAACRQAAVQLCTIWQKDYPNILKEIFDPPMVLFYRGTLQPQAARVAMVGSRRFTPYGEGIALEFGERLAAAGLTLVSGAARGIDTASHRGALKGGRTVAVLGCGADVVYPPENRRLLAQIIDAGGAVISEYGPGTQPLPAFFPARNRIISGLSQGTVVIEAASRSGSLITAELALSEGRDVFAVPGSIYSPTSQGCNRLIQQGAKLVQGPGDILEEYGLAVPPKKKTTREFTPEERQVWQVLSFERPLSMDEIIQSLPDGEMSNLAFILLQMELKGLVIENELHAYRRAERE
ncbi:DNA processing protein [Selenomonas sp. GACV-9]|uniref:DNA-processing protein DprA n=1 Tax=Selenomonas sp. GACV-9 TaxID=3158782 RepID=UPI0008E2758D|nr:DNA processing protein [Selenomonas ruminantium]